jgi:nucleoside-diphosphate-sugar epimerase
VRVLVTGASGFSGSFIAAELARSGFDVTGTYRHAPGFAAPYGDLKGLALVQKDLAEAAQRLDPFDTIVHTAATSPAPGVTDDGMRRDNAVATANLVEAALEQGCQRFIYFSSLSIYGTISQPVVDESTPIRDPDMYGVTKYQGEEALQAQAGRLSSISLRLPGVLGPGAHRNWLSSVAAKLKSGETVSAFNLNAPFNNACHVVDMARLVAGLCGRTWEGADSVVLGARGSITVRGAIKRLADALGIELDINEVEAREAGFILSSERAISRWGYDPMEIGDMIERYGRES